jgi:hypothetical protein
VPVDAAVLRYRVMAYITGVVLIVLCFVGIPLQLAAHYIIYLIFAYLLTRRLRMPIGRTLLVLLAGTIPVLTFVVERWVYRSYVVPARAQQEAATASPAARAR